MAVAATVSRLCRDCGACDAQAGADGRCATCGSPRVVAHPELHQLTLAHLDCDAFYATIEKRDDPRLADLPVIIGGGRRVVVSACCYVARIQGVRSAMPMFKALELCPQAVVIRPNMEKYRAVGRAVRTLMRETTPLVEPLSIDEAFLDLAGTEALHGRSAASTLARLARRIEREIGITISVGLVPNKMLAKLASDRDKPRGFAVIGRAEARAFLATLPVSALPGVGVHLAERLRGDGLRTVADLQRRSAAELTGRLGSVGGRLHAFALGNDDRLVVPDAAPKSVSAETTLERDLADPAALAQVLWPLCETVSRRLKQLALAGRCITLKLKTHDFRTLTRSRTMSAPTRLAEVIYRQSVELLRREGRLPACRLIGVGASDLTAAAMADPPDLADPEADKRRRVEEAIDAVRARVGEGAIAKGRAFSTSAPESARSQPDAPAQRTRHSPGPSAGRRRSPGNGS